jgi:type I restriction enzyme R subunit
VKFTEETLEQAVIELFSEEKIQHYNGETIHKEISDVLLRDDLKQFLLNQYASDNITSNEIASIIRKLELFPSSALYNSNKEMIKLISDGFVLKREDHNQKDLFIQLIDFKTIGNIQSDAASHEIRMAAEPKTFYQAQDNNIYKIVNQLEIQGYEKRIPDAIVYINGLPLVVIE